MEVQKWVDDLASTRGKHCANRNYDTMRAVFGWALRKEVIDEMRNPCLGVDKYKVRSRERFVLPSEFSALAAAIDAEPNETLRDYFWMCLFTGARKSNVLSMSWSNINFELRTWTIPDTKNGDQQVVNLVDAAIKILTARKEKACSQWVFPSPRRSGHLTCPKSAWNRIRLRSGLKDLRIHDLRRTLGSYMAIQGASATIIGKALGHRSVQATAVYSRLTQDPVREAVEQAVATLIGRQLDV
jgi:integrase